MNAGPPITPTRWAARCRTAAAAGGAVAASLGAATLAGWMLGSHLLRSGLSSAVAMNPATAVAFVLSGAALVLLSRASGARPLAVRACAAAVGLVAALKLAHLATGWDAGVDRALFPRAVDLVAGGPNRMAPNTAADFLLVSVALLFMDAGPGRLRRAAKAAAVVVAWTALLALIGYAYGVRRLYGVPSFIPMAPNTAAAFFVLGGGLLFSRPDELPASALIADDAGGRLARRLLPACLFLPAALGWAILLGRGAGYYEGAVGLSLLAAATSLLFSALVYASARLLSAADAALQLALADLRRANAALAARMHDRSEKLAETETTLRLSEDRFRDLFELSPEAIFVQSDGAFSLVNAALLRLLGAYGPEELVGKPVIAFVHPDCREAALERMRVLTEGRRPVALADMTWVRTDGTTVTVECAASPYSCDGKPGAQVFLRDVTARKKLEQQLLQSQKMEAVGRLAGGVAHDFNNILTAIGGFSSFVLSGTPANDPRRDDVLEIVKATERAAALTRQLLAFSRRQVFQPKDLDLNAVVSGLEGMLKRLLGDDVKLETHLKLGAGRVRADQGQLEQVIVNLAVNSRDAMPRGGTITIETAEVVLDEEYALAHPEVKPGRHVMLSVSDTGRGMTPETLSRVFEPFFTTKEPGKGTGLGLSTVHGIVRQSGGSVFVYSELDRGTTFKVFLPRIDAPAEPAPTPRPRGAAAGAGTVLVVDDDAQVRRVVCRALSRDGWEVLEAADPAAAMRLARERSGPVDILLTDVVMPGMTGDELAGRLTAERPRLQVLFMSGFSDRAVARQAVLAPSAVFVQKPLAVEELSRTIADLMAGRG